MLSRAPRRSLSHALGATLIAALAVTAFAAPASAATSASTAEAMIIGWVNTDRAAAGLAPLRGDSDLAYIAGVRASRMASANTHEPHRRRQPRQPARLPRRPVVSLRRDDRLVVGRLARRRRASHLPRVDGQPAASRAADEHAASTTSALGLAYRSSNRPDLRVRGDDRVPRPHPGRRPCRDRGAAPATTSPGPGTATTRACRPTPPACATSTSSTASTAGRGGCSATTPTSHSRLPA